MDEGSGTNVEIGLSESCDPGEFSDEWAYNCKNFGESHLIKGLFDVSYTFIDQEKWEKDERKVAEYVVFLGYSGVVLREALLNATIKNDFLSIWGFHDGDMFFLLQKNGEIRTVVTNVDM